MCGIAGIFDPQRSLGNELHSRTQLMLKAIRQRGPDSERIWIDRDQRIGLAHTRLAIVDLSDAGAQPYEAQSAPLQLVYNGEIYNHTEIRRKLDRRQVLQWRGHSDTETLAESLSICGPVETLREVSGMFAFAAYSISGGSLMLARDNFGQKPLYYWCDGKRFIFASEVRALLASGLVPRKLSLTALELFQEWNYIPAPYCIIEGVKKLAPGHLLTVSRDEGALGIDMQMQPIYKAVDALNAAAIRGGSSQSPGHLIDGALRSAIESELLGDVDFGCFLSGGVDSALVSAITQRICGKKLNLFTVGFDHPALDEAPRARAIAAQLNCRHEVIYLSGEEMPDLQEAILSAMDEPLGDASFAPTWFVSKLARESVKYVLSGDGGDELFLGYNRHRLAAMADRRREGQNSWLYPFILRLLEILKILEPSFRVIERTLTRSENTSQKFIKICQAFWENDHERLYRQLSALNPMVGGQAEIFTWSQLKLLAAKTKLPAIVLADLTCYLPDNGLHKVDMASMANSLEVRTPFLDQGVVAAALTDTLQSKVGAISGKIHLRELLPKYYSNLKPFSGKRGFSPPARLWLAQSLKPWWVDCAAVRKNQSPALQAATAALVSSDALHRARGTERIWGACVLTDWCHRNKILE